MTFYKYSLSLCSLLLLGACSYAVESSNQNITFMTPDAQNAKCYVYIDKLKYQVYPPQTVNIKKSSNDMRVECNAPGNRHIEMDVPAEFSKRAIWGGPAGVAWDYASQSLFYYPSVIAIDFSQEKIKANKLPQHNNSDIKQPEEYDLEEFKPSQPLLNSDKNIVKQPILRRGEEYPDEYIGDAIEAEGNAQNQGEKGDLQSVIHELTGTEEASNVEAPDPAKSPVATDMEVPSTPQGEAVSAPVPIYPGQ